MTKTKSTLDRYDLGSVHSIFTGAAPLGKESVEDLLNIFPSWCIRQGYGKCVPKPRLQLKNSNTRVNPGLTETSTVVCSTSSHDVVFGSSGSLLPGYQAKLVTIEGAEITGYDQRGELLVKGPSVTLGYLNNAKATRETFQDGWMRTGDEVMVRKSPAGNEHLWITDRIKELIKVKVIFGFRGFPPSFLDIANDWIY